MSTYFSISVKKSDKVDEEYDIYNIVLSNSEIDIKGNAILEEENTYFLDDEFIEILSSHGIDYEHIIDALEDGSNIVEVDFKRVNQKNNKITEHELYLSFLNMYKDKVNLVPNKKVEEILQLAFSVGIYAHPLTQSFDINKMNSFTENVNIAIEVFLKKIENLKI